MACKHLSYTSGYTDINMSMKNYTVSDIQHFPTYHVLTVRPNTNSDRIDFWPGQYAAIAFKSGLRLSPMRCFSIVSSPHSEELQFAMRPHGKFTRKIARLQPGHDIKIQGPFGSFVFDPTDSNIIMLAAGIGITPFMSMLRHAVKSGMRTPITLVYAASDREDIPFQDELLKLQAQKSNLKVIFVTKHGVSDPSQNTYVGRVNEDFMRKLTGERWKPFTYFICGPKGFTDDLQGILRSNQVDAERIVTESFTQSTKHSWSLSNMSIPSLTYLATAATLFIGIAFIMALDLVRFVPKTVQAVAPTSTTTTTAATPTATDTTTTPTTSTATTPTATTNSNSTPATSTQSTQTYYQPPSRTS